MDWESFYNRFREPDFVPGYEIQNRLGGGAFGEVYKARKHSIGKSYAVKFLKVDDEQQREAIERELEQVRHFAAIDHPNLVTIEDMGSVLGVPYLIMGYAGEETLARCLKRGDLDRRSAVLYFVQACRGVLALHDRRLVHFDLKPGNIFIKGDVARVGDYGLSKLMSEGRLTLSFGRGTPHYMAPEILRSRADHRADIYSLGVILFESLSGSVPYEPQTPGGIIVRERDAPPEFPSDFPADLRPVVERCLRLDPAQRYDTVQELLDDMGQTARPGDSIALDGLSAGAAVPAPAPAKRAMPAATPAAGVAAAAALGASATAHGVASAAGSGGSGLRHPARETAAELTRGAVEVARGVWDGIKTAKQRDGGGRPPPLVAGGVRGVEPRAAASVPRPAPAARDATAPAATLSGGGTIPVPPRAAGGVVGSVVATVVLAVEVLVSIVTGVVRGVGRGFALVAGGARAGGSLLGKLVRLALFLAFLAVLGAVIMTVVIAFLGGRVNL